MKVDFYIDYTSVFFPLHSQKDVPQLNGRHVKRLFATYGIDVYCRRNAPACGALIEYYKLSFKNKEDLNLSVISDIIKGTGYSFCCYLLSDSAAKRLKGMVK